jgi:hypothetical protein
MTARTSLRCDRQGEAKQAGLVTVIDGVVSALRPPTVGPVPAGPIVWLR